MTKTQSDGMTELDTLATASEAAAAVPDPELPVVTLGDLGIVRDVTLAADGAVEVALTPTYVGCPATEAIAADVRERVAAAFSGTRAVRTRTVLSPAWSTDWITDEGRRKLREHGIAPPSGRRAVGPVTVELGRRADGGRGAVGQGGSAAGGAGVDVDASLLSPSPHPPTQIVQPCPHCGSADTRLLSAFGSTPCQSLRACRACGEPFGAIKTL
jgi:ring-1,2-phenylacetyl-CoA epoxidase subunit PaaD